MIEEVILNAIKLYLFIIMFDTSLAISVLRILFMQMQLKSLYKAGLSAAEQEENLLRKALSRIYEIRSIKNERRIQVFQSIIISFERVLRASPKHQHFA